MIKKDIIRMITDSSDLSEEVIREVLDSFFFVIKSALSVGEELELRGFASFRIRKRKRRLGKNPKTGESVPIPPKKIVKVVLGRELKNLIIED